MTKGDGKPCKKCGTSEWVDRGDCRECHRRSTRRWKRENPDKNRDHANRWYKDNSDRGRERSLKWKKSNPEKVKAMGNRRRTRKTEAGGSYTTEEFQQLCDLYDNRCLACGKKGKLEFDHVIPVSKGGTSDIGNGQPLCRSCNSSKRDKATDYRTKPGILRWIQEKLL